MRKPNYQVYSPEQAKERLEEINVKERLVVNGKGTERRVRSKAETIISKPPHRLGITTFSEHLGKIKELAEYRGEQSLWQEEIEIKINTPYKWFGVRPSADWHIGASGVDYEKLDEMLAGFLQNDNLRTVLLGNLGNFFVPKGKYPEGMLSDVVTPQEQLVALKKFFTEYQDEILAVTTGPCHEDWVYQSAGIDTYEYLVRELDIPLVHQGGLVTLNFGEISYDIIPFHKISKFKSSFNLTHAHKRVLELHRDADCVMGAHIHKGAFEKTMRGGKEVSLVQCGTLLTDDKWGKKQGFLGRPYIHYPIVLFNTQEKRMQIMDNLSDAEDLLQIRA